MNPRQRRGVLMIAMSVVLAIFVFMFVAAYVADVNSRVGDHVTVYRASREIPAYEPLSRSNLDAVRVPSKWTSPGTRLRLDQLENRKVAFKLSRGAVLSADMLVPASDLSSTQREVAINVSAVTGVGGRVVPGAIVDVYAVFADVPGLPKQVRVLVRNVRVVSVGGRETLEDADEDTGLRSERAVVAVTLALESADALAVTYANAFAEEVRLVGLPTGDALNRTGEADDFDAGDLGGEPIPEPAE